MKFHRRIANLLALLGAFSSLACQGATQAEIVKEHLGKELDPREIVVSMERTVCLGSCPAYRVTLSANGEGEYEGMALVKTTGIRQITVPKEDVLKIVNELLRVRIFDAPEEYHTRDVITSHDGKLTLGSVLVSDGSSTYIELRIANHSKRVRLYENVPKELGVIPELIDEAVDIQQWIGTPCERPRSSIGPAPPAGECDR